MQSGGVEFCVGYPRQPEGRMTEDTLEEHDLFQQQYGFLYQQAICRSFISE